MPLSKPIAISDVIALWSGTPLGMYLRDDGVLAEPVPDPSFAADGDVLTKVTSEIPGAPSYAWLAPAPTSGFFGNTVTTVADVEYVIQDGDAHVIFSPPYWENTATVYLVWPDASPENRGRVIVVTMPNSQYASWKTAGETIMTNNDATWTPPYDQSFGYSGTRTWWMMSTGDPNKGWGVIGSWYNRENREPFAPNLENPGEGHVIQQINGAWAAGPLNIHTKGRIAYDNNLPGLEGDLFQLDTYLLRTYMAKLTVQVYMQPTVTSPFSQEALRARTAYNVNLAVAEDGTQTFALTEIASEVASVVTAGTISLAVTAVQTPGNPVGTVMLHLEITTDSFVSDPDGYTAIHVVAYVDDPVAGPEWVTPQPPPQ